MFPYWHRECRRSLEYRLQIAGRQADLKHSKLLLLLEHFQRRCACLLLRRSRACYHRIVRRQQLDLPFSERLRLM